MKIQLPSFDEMLEMARNDPDRLEKLRKRLTGAVIDGASTEVQRRKLEGTQFRVNMERRRAATPLAATIRISELMCQSLADLHRSLVMPVAQQVQERASIAAGGAEAVTKAGPGARILPFLKT